jgi:hypothetical protein
MKPEEMNMIMSMNLMKPFDDGIQIFLTALAELLPRKRTIVPPDQILD